MNDKSKNEKPHGGWPSPPAISLPKGGGAIRGIGETFAANPVTGTGSMSVPVITSPGRSGFGPQLSLHYDSGSGNGPFGFGWSLSLPSITRKTDKGLPQYRDAEESDVFILSGAEDLTPVLVLDGGEWKIRTQKRELDGVTYSIKAYRPRIESLFARIEQWKNLGTGVIHWRSITKDNVTTLYGKDNDSRVFDPAETDSGHPTRIFSWLICESYDDKGNAILYRYARENEEGVDLAQAHESNRATSARSTNRYVKRILYGNRASRLVQPDLQSADWMFEVVFDYGEHDKSNPKPGDTGKRLCRNDPFSSYRAGFEIRTYHLCQRVLMFHHFPDEEGVGSGCLVRSTDLVYRDSRNNPDDQKKGNPIASFISSITQSGYRRQKSGYLKRSFPPLEFKYSEAIIQEEIQEVDGESLHNLPYGLDGIQYQWVDLDGEGVCGILTEQQQGWFYKRNLSPISIRRDNGNQTAIARFAPVEQVGQRPSLADARDAQQQFLDLAGDGQVDFVQLKRPLSGFYERTGDEMWSGFTPFEHFPTIDWQDPNLRFIDLTGDGHADAIISEESVFTWYPSLGEAGFGSAQRVQQAIDEEKGPRLVFADGTQSIYLADFSGDGLSDLARIRNGEVCYWPNLGYGRFGDKVTMDNAPWFDYAELFAQSRIRLADIDGSGVTDIIYLSGDGARLYFNQSGNSWSEARELSQFPDIDNLSSVMAVDLLGNGTACLVWSSALPDHVRQPMRYVDLMGGQKPHLLVGMKNNLGAETSVRYATSTRFYLEDKLAGNPWITRLAFPVHVVERVEIVDRISRNRFVNRYAYHHGYFDGVEREFRGFGMVEQWDTEEFAAFSANDDFSDATNIDAASHVPPVLTRTWFHTGAFLDGGVISRQFERDYYREGDPSLGEAGLSDAQLEAMLLDDTVLPDSIKMPDGTRKLKALSGDEAREACRALKGLILRQEVYSLDGTGKQDRPYGVSERSYTIEWLQPQGDNQHAVFFVHPRETIDFHYERELFDVAGHKRADPRVTHAMTLDTDAFGNVLQSVAIGYGRRRDDSDSLLTDADKQKQKRTLITYTDNHYTNAVMEDDDYRAPLLAEARTYELCKIKPAANQIDVTNLFRFDEMRQQVKAASDGLHEVPYENLEASGLPEAPHRRLIEDVRTIYRKDDLTIPLAPGELDSLALPFESYKLAFTSGLLSSVYQRRREGKPPENLISIPASIMRDEGGYVDLDGDGHWWIPSGRVFFHADKSATPAQELDHARDHFFLPQRFQDPFLNNTVVAYDRGSLGTEYNLLVSATRDAAGNEVKAEHDYRVLQPRLVTDPNGNRSQAAFDALGMIVGTAIMGKAGEKAGDSLADFVADLDEATILAHLQNPFANPHAILNRATTRLVYDLEQYRRSIASGDPQPGVVYTLVRETHDADLASGALTLIQHSFSYSDGFGREIQNKIQAEPGPLIEGGPKVDSRWVGSGWTIFNNKGKPVRKYEPFFSPTHQFQFAKMVGVSTILFYDPVERVIATLHPNRTYEKVVFDSWRQATWDVNDTVLESDPKNDPDIGSHFRRLPEAEYKPTWHTQRQAAGTDPQEQAAAQKAADHANTPTVTYFDTLGRTFLTLSHNRFERAGKTIDEKYATRAQIDIEGNQREVKDAKNRIVVRYDYDMLSGLIHQASMEAGERWMLNDVAGKPLYTWNSRDHRLRTEYDELRRPIRLFLLNDTGPEILAGRIVYGEGESDAEKKNLRGKVFKVFDDAGVEAKDAYDFKNNLLRSSRQLAIEYKTTLIWSGKVDLEPTTYATETTYDALNRPLTRKTPDNSITRITYNEANLPEKIEVNLRGAAATTIFVQNIDYNARGQRKLIVYGNGVRTQYDYDPQTFRLTRLLTKRDPAAFPDDCPPPKPGWPGCEVQSLYYTYDPAGNITHIRDDAQQAIYFSNQRVEPDSEYTYDAIYRLIEATGREHLGGLPPRPTSHTDSPRVGLSHPGAGNAMGRYLQQYVYDEAGNISQMIHRSTNTMASGWTRDYAYAEASLLESGEKSNRLTSTQVRGEPLEPYTYDAHGNMMTMPHLPLMRWNYRDHLQATAQQVITGGTPATTYYVYDAQGQRVRKVTEGQAFDPATPTRQDERIYLSGFEIYRKYQAGSTTVEFERETLHVMDDKKRLALVETRTIDTSAPPATLPSTRVRYQFDNHLGSASIELDDKAAVISYEEYYPYGSTSYQAMQSGLEVSAKRYRYTGRERDEENGFYYHGARYYLSWLGRWNSCDPIGIEGGINLFVYTRNNPIIFIDPNGTSEYGVQDEKAKVSRTDYPVCSPKNPAGIMTPESIRTKTESRSPTLQSEVRPERHKQAPARSSQQELSSGQLWLNRGIGVLQIAGGALNIGGALAAGIAGATVSDDFSILSLSLYVLGADAVLSGMETLSTGTVQETRVSRAGVFLAEKAGAGEYAKWIGAGLEIGANLGTSMAASMMKSAPKLTEAALEKGTTRVTQFYAPGKGSFGKGAEAALSDGRAGAWVSPFSAAEQTGWTRLLTGRGNYNNYVEFSVDSSRLSSPSGLKYFYSRYQKVIPDGASLKNANPVFGKLPPNPAQQGAFGGISSAAASGIHRADEYLNPH